MGKPPQRKHPTGRAKGEPVAGTGRGRRSRRARGGSAPESTPETRTGPRWWNSVTKTIIGLGALAGAITAVVTLVVSLWPKPDPDASVEFTSVRLAVNVPFDEYEQRVSVKPARAAVRTEVVPTPEPTPGEPTGSGEPSAPIDTSQPSTPEETSPAAPPASPSQSPGPGATGQPFARTDVQLVEFCRHIESVLLPGCENSSVMDQMGNGLLFAQWSSPSASPSGPPPPRAVAHNLEQVFQQARTTTTESGQQQPLGVVVTADLTLGGLRGQPVHLSWSIWQQGGKTRLFRAWFTEIVAHQFKPSAEKETRSADVWVPLPRDTGSYFVRLRVSVQGQPLASIDSEPFK